MVETKGKKRKFEGLSREKILEAVPDSLKKQIAMRHPLAFAKRYVPRLMKKTSPPFHVDMVETVMENDRVLFLAPRDHAKSTLFSFIYPLYRIVLNRNIRISLVSDTQTQAYKFIKAVRFELENNDKLVEDFGEFEGDNWQKSQFTVQREINYKDPTMAGFGLNSSKLGDRADLIICDDIINKDVCLTSARRKKASRWYFEVLTNFLEEDGGQMITIGTRQHEKDLYKEIMDKPTYVSKVYRAVKDDDRVLWPQKWTYDKLMDRKKEIGSLAFARQFQNEITSEGSSVFPEKLLEPLLNREAGMVNPFGERPRWLKKYRLFMGVDLASSAAVGADYVVLVTVGVDEDKNRKLLHVWRDKGVPFQKQIDEIIRLDEFFDYERIVIESNQYQSILPSTLKEETDLPIMSYQTGAEKHTEDVGVPSLRILFENGKYEFPYGEECREEVDTLLGELNGLAWDEGKLITTAAHKDTVMALWLAEKGIDEANVGNRFAII
ncbi:MAG: hypothetical protein ACLFT7_02435, partial [Thermoplasmata archaeon]